MSPMMGDSHGSMVIKQPKSTRPLLLGVIPHTYCVPAVKGCGFCTFPHESLSRRQMIPLAAAIATEIQSAARILKWQTVPAVYFGGGTANLTPLPALGILLGALSAFRLRKPEITLEGVPRFFTAEQLALLRDAGSTRVRISMGVQTFNADWLAKMGRSNIGNPQQVEAAVALAQASDVGTSVDLLLNLPGQPVSAMVADAQRAIALGVDQICLYHLVLKEGLPVPWANADEMMAARPDNETAYTGWRAARESLLEAGFIQRTLTNFERPGLDDSARFIYEDHSFRPHTCDARGFGPGGITGLNFGTDIKALKWINQSKSEDYLTGHARFRSATRAYVYEPFEDALMQLTRGLALIRQPTDEGALATNLPAFEPELSVLADAGLITRGEADISLTQRGMFYADSVAGLLAWRTVVHRKAVGLNEPDIHPMG